MISYLVWNIRGVDNASSVRRIKHIMRVHNISLVALLEPQWSRISITDLQRLLHGFDSVTNESGTIWIVWKADIQCSVISNESQQFTLSYCYKDQQIILTCVYASCSPEIRKQLWSSLLQPGYNQPWMAIWDFNVVRSQDEKVGGMPVDTNAISTFNDMINQVGFLDGGFPGFKFTWRNNRIGSNKILQRLDMGLINTCWGSSFTTSITHLHRICSYRAPLLVKVSKPNTSGYAFRYINVWEKHHSFKKVVEECLAQPQVGRPLVRFAEKIKTLKKTLKAWNTNMFGNINHVIS